MICKTNLIQQLSFINKPLAQHFSGTIMLIFRSSRPYITTCLTGSQDSSLHIKKWKPYEV